MKLFKSFLIGIISMSAFADIVNPPVSVPNATNATNLTGGTVAASKISVNSGLVISGTPPTISSCGSGATITASNTAAFKIVTGTGSPATCTVNMPTAPNGWNCQANDITSASSIFVVQTSNSASSVVDAAYSITTGLASTFGSGDTILYSCVAY